MNIEYSRWFGLTCTVAYWNIAYKGKYDLAVLTKTFLEHFTVVIIYIFLIHALALTLPLFNFQNIV